MKTTLFSGLALFAASASGVMTFAWLGTGDPHYFLADLAASIGAFGLQLQALGAARAEQSRTMLRDLRHIEALLDEKEFDHAL
jgi:hypothetical protein